MNVNKYLNKMLNKLLDFITKGYFEATYRELFLLFSTAAYKRTEVTERVVFSEVRLQGNVVHCSLASLVANPCYIIISQIISGTQHVFE